METGIVFCTNEIVVNDVVVQKKTNQGQTIWIVERNEKNFRFKKRMKEQKRTILNRFET